MTPKVGVLGRGDLDEVPEQLEAVALTFLRMELGGVHVVAPDGRSKGLAVAGPGRDHRFIGGLRIEAVDEVKVGPLGDAAEQGTFRFLDFHLVPSDLRDLEAGFLGGGLEANDGSLEDPESQGAGIEFLAPIEQRLVPDADAKERPAVVDPASDGFKQFTASQGVHAVVERADTGEDHARGLVQARGRVDTPDIGADRPECFLDAADVAGAVIEER